MHLGKAVPTTQEVPSLIYELAHASKQKSVEFASISSSAAGSGAAASAPASASSSAAGFQQMPFTFIFNGTYSGLEHMLRQLTSFATKTRSGKLKVNGRLLTVQGVAMHAGHRTGRRPKPTPT